MSFRPSCRREYGQALVLTAMFVTVLLGFAALAIDVGRMALTKRQLQNGVDAAALAGAAHLPISPSKSTTTAQDYAGRNGIIAGELLQSVSSSGAMANDTISVSATRPVEYTFGRVLGLSEQSLGASAQARVAPVTGMDVDNPRFFPYAVWGGNVPRMLEAGTRITYRTNAYADVNVLPNKSCPNPKEKHDNCNWDVTSNTFKGYFHWQSGATTINLKAETQVVDSQGGNGMGTQTELGQLLNYQREGIPVILPVIDYASDANNVLRIRIISFTCVLLDPLDTSGSSNWTGVITSGCSVHGHRGGSTPPAPDVPTAVVPFLTK